CRKAGGLCRRAGMPWLRLPSCRRIARKALASRRIAAARRGQRARESTLSSAAPCGGRIERAMVLPNPCKTPGGGLYEIGEAIRAAALPARLTARHGPHDQIWLGARRDGLGQRRV